MPNICRSLRALRHNACAQWLLNIDIVIYLILTVNVVSWQSVIVHGNIKNTTVKWHSIPKYGLRIMRTNNLIPCKSQSLSQLMVAEKERKPDLERNDIRIRKDWSRCIFSACLGETVWPLAVIRRIGTVGQKRGREVGATATRQADQ